MEWGYIAIGAAFGAILFDGLWRFLSRKQSALIQEQKVMLDEQHGAIKLALEIINNLPSPPDVEDK